MGPLIAVLAACVNPVAYGAVADDGKPDNDALQQAVEAAEQQGHGAEVCIPDGTFDLGPPTRLASVWIRKGDIAIHGNGEEATVLRMSGDGEGKTWYGLFLYGATHVELRDFTITATATTHTQEQTHLIQIGPTAVNIHVTGLRLGPMRRADQAIGDGAGGDCIRLLGEADQMVEQVTIDNDDFIGCDRSGVTVQRGVRGLVVAHDSFSLIGDTPIDFEPTATAPIENIAMIDLAITRAPKAQGTWAITIAGYGMENPTRNVVVSDCDLVGGGIGLLNTKDVIIANNRITHGTGTNNTIHAMRRVISLLVKHNVIVRPADSPPGALVGMSHNNGGIPTDIHIIDNELTQATNAPLVDDVSAPSVEIRGNHMIYRGDKPSYAVQVNAVADDVDDITVAGNTIEGAIAGVLRLAASHQSIGHVSLAHNHSPNAPVSVQCEASNGKFNAPITEDSDQLGKARSNCATLVTASGSASP
jgi:hypothetical protein